MDSLAFRVGAELCEDAGFAIVGVLDVDVSNAFGNFTILGSGETGAWFRPMPPLQSGVNVSANATHHASVGPFATVAPNAVLPGRVSVGEGAYIGASPTVLPEKRIGAGAVVDAGAVVAHDLPPGAIVAGVPVRVLRHNSARKATSP